MLLVGQSFTQSNRGDAWDKWNKSNGLCCGNIQLVTAQTCCKMTQVRRELVDFGQDYGSCLVICKNPAGKNHQSLITVVELPFSNQSRKKINQITMEITWFPYKGSHEPHNKFN